MKIRALLAIIAFTIITGCSSHVTRPDVTADAATPPIKALHSYAVEMSPDAKQQLADNVKFDVDELTRVFGRTLEGKGLISTSGDYSVKIVVNDIRVRSTFNAIMWGFMAGNDHLNGDAIVLDSADVPIYTFEVNAAYALGGIGGGQDSSRLNWLYEEFSEQVADELDRKRGTQGD